MKNRLQTMMSRSSGFIARENFIQHNQTVAALYAPHDGFKDAMLSAGLVSDVAVIPDGEIHRFKADGDKRPDSWFVFYGDGGAFGNWRTSLRETWFRGDLDAIRKQEIRKDIAAAQKAAARKPHASNARLHAAQGASGTRRKLQQRIRTWRLKMCSLMG